MIFLNPKETSRAKRLALAQLDVVQSRFIQIGKKLKDLVKDGKYPKKGNSENLLGPPLAWLGSCLIKNYIGSPLSDPFDVAVYKPRPFELEYLSESIGKLLRRIYRIYLNPIIQECDTFPVHLGDTTKEQKKSIKRVFCSFRKCREHLIQGKLDKFVLSLTKNCRDSISEQGLSLYSVLWDTCHSEKPEIKAFSDVPLFHDETVALPDDPLFSSSKNLLEEQYVPSKASHMSTSTLLKKTARQCIKDAYNTIILPYEQVRLFKPIENTEMIKEFHVGQTDAEDANMVPNTTYFGMTDEAYSTYKTNQREKIVCMPQFTIFQTLVIRVIFAHEILKILPPDVMKTKVGLYLMAWQDTMNDLMFQLVVSNDCVEEFSDTYLENSGVYQSLYPHNRRFIIAGYLPDASNLVARASIWKDVKTGKSDKVSDFLHMFLQKYFHQKCKIRNVRKMVNDYAGDSPIASYLIRDNVHMTLSGGYPVCVNRPSMISRVALKSMAASFMTNEYTYFLQWVNKNRRIVFYAQKEFLFYQMGFAHPIKGILDDTTLFSSHEKGVREYIDKCRKKIDKYFVKDTVNYFEGYEPSSFSKNHPAWYSNRRLMCVLIKDMSESGYTGEESNDLELSLGVVACRPGSGSIEEAEKLQNYTSFLNTSDQNLPKVMQKITEQGEKVHHEQQKFYTKLCKKSFSDELATITRTIIPYGVEQEEERKLYLREKINAWNDAMIIVSLEDKIKKGEIVINDDYDTWQEFEGGNMKKYCRKRQKTKVAFMLSFQKLVDMEQAWDIKNRRPRILEQANDDYLAILDYQKENYTRSFNTDNRTLEGMSFDEKAVIHSEDIKKAAWCARMRQDGWFDFITWMRIIGVSRFGRLWWKYIYFQYEKQEIPDNRFGTLTEILLCLRPRDFQIIREFCATYENAPVVRKIYLGPRVMKYQIQALRKRFALDMFSQTPMEVGNSYYCPCCGAWADVNMTVDSKPFKVYGIGLDGAVMDCLTDKIHCSKQGSVTCSANAELKVVNTIGVAVSIGYGPFKVRCASCGILTDWIETNYTERGPSCESHLEPNMVIKHRPSNTYLKRRLITLQEVEAMESIQKNKLYTGADTRMPRPKCHYCSRAIFTKAERLKTINILYSPKKYDKTHAAFRVWARENYKNKEIFPVTNKTLKESFGTFGRSPQEIKEKDEKTPKLPDVVPLFCKVPLCDGCYKHCSGWLKRIPVPDHDSFMEYMTQQWESKTIEYASTGPYSVYNTMSKLPGENPRRVQRAITST